MSYVTHISPTDLTGSDIPAQIETLKIAHGQLPAASPLAELVQQLISALEEGSSFTGVIDEQELTPNEAAKLLGISRPHLMERYVRTGLISARKENTHYRIKASEITDFLERRDRAARDVAVAISSRHNNEPSLNISDDDMKELDTL